MDVKESLKKELPSILRPNEQVINVVSCSKIPETNIGILVTTDLNLWFVSKNLKSENVTIKINYEDISSVLIEKGLLFSKLTVSYQNSKLEVDYIQNEPAKNAKLGIDKRIAEIKQEVIKKQLDEENNTDLSTIEKMQFKKFISEQSALSILEVETMLGSLSKVETDELIKEFKREKRNNTVNSQVQAQPQVIQVTVSNEQNNNNPVCPKCKSTQVTHNTKGFGAGRAVVGTMLTGGIGLLGGFIGKNTIMLTCLKCGNKWRR